mgnify:CR=1 FL=1
MAAKTIMKRIAIAALSAVILQGVTPLDSLNVYASENTGASYTALDLYHIYRINAVQSIH